MLSFKSNLLLSKKQSYQYKLLEILLKEENALTITQIVNSLGCNQKYAYVVANQLCDENELSKKNVVLGMGLPY